MGKNILLIEDEVKLARFIELELKYEGYDIAVCNDGRLGFDEFQKNNYDLILIDLMLPGLNGLEICRRIRKLRDVPIIMITAKDEIIDKVSGLDAGLDDYLTKPFAIEELLARMRVALKRVRPEAVQKNVYACGDLVLDSDKHLVRVGDQNVDFTKKEYDLLLYLIKSKNIVLTREQILNQVWGYNYIGETNVVDVYVRYLRSKIDEPFNRKFIHTIRGVGYYIKDDE